MLAPLLFAGALGMAPEASSASETHAASDPAAVVHVVRTLAQVRFQQTSVSILPALEERVRAEFLSPSVAADALRIIRDTARVHDGFALRRAWFELEANPVERLRGELRVDFARLLDEDTGDHHGGGELHHIFEVALAEVTPFDELSLSAGLVEAPFSLWELVHDPEFELAEKGPAHELLEHLGYAGSQVGGLVHVAPLEKPEWLGLYAAVLDGEAHGAQQYRGPGLISGRVLSEPVEFLRIGAGIAWRPRPVDAWVEQQRFRYRDHERGTAYATDLTLSVNRLVVRAELLTGDRTDIDVETPLKRRRGDARTFMAAWGMAAMRFPIGTMALTPALRAEWLDTDREHDDVGNILHLSAALNLDFATRLRLLWDLSQHYVEPGTRNWEYEIGRYDTDYITGTVQLQIRL